MEYPNDSFIKSKDIYYQGVLSKISKSANPLQALWEAITNSFEAIRDLKENARKNITVRLFFSKTLIGKEQLDFQKIEVEDEGIGFNDINFKRFLMYQDDRKGYNNRGSGRLQLIHTFNKCEYKSVFLSDTNYKQINFIVSKSKEYLDKNAIVYFKSEEVVESKHTGTTLIMKELIDSKDVNYTEISTDKLKDSILLRYMPYLCAYRKYFPIINIEQYINDIHNVDSDRKITDEDIPPKDKEAECDIYYTKWSNDAKNIEHSENKEHFIIKSYKIHKSKLKQNEIKITSKGEIVDNIVIPMTSLLDKDIIDDSRFMALISSKYIDNLDSDMRGEFKLITKEEFKVERGFESDEVILFEDIKDEINSSFRMMYPEVQKAEKEKMDRISELKNMFLLNDATINDLNFTINDSEEDILKKIYIADSKLAAKKDIEIKHRIDSLNNLDTTTNDYSIQLEKEVAKLAKEIPLQNRNAITLYIARRNLVLKLFQKILGKELVVQQSVRNKDEKLLHNLFFHQGSDNPDNSDLWIINEDFIYFKGISDQRLCDIKIDNIQLFTQEFSKEEEEYLHSLGEKRETHKPDVLLFPEESKCIIIEFKNPKVNVGKHLDQINKYAYLIRNHTNKNFNIDTFYGYLIGEAINAKEVRSYDGDFKESYKFHYQFRPNKVIVGENGKSDGNLYTEVLSYSSLLERAEKRNNIFIEKLKNGNKKNKEKDSSIE